MELPPLALLMRPIRPRQQDGTKGVGVTRVTGIAALGLVL